MYDMYDSDFISSLLWVKASVNTNLYTEFLLQIWKQQEDNKQQPCYWLATNKTRRKTQSGNTQQKRLKTQKKTARKNRDPLGLQEAPLFTRLSTESFGVKDPIVSHLFLQIPSCNGVHGGASIIGRKESKEGGPSKKCMKEVIYLAILQSQD
jgi:hypothetical protein